jgi:NitT/TauT family transport system permease protein
MNHFFYLFEIDGLLAYTMAFVVVMLLIEIAFVEPLERRLTRWRK